MPAPAPTPSPSTPPPEARHPLVRLSRLARRPLERFLQVEAASGIVLLAAAAVALGWANSPWARSYGDLWHLRMGLRLGAFAFERTLEWFVNDVLMVVFFFVVGLEIRREIHDGELSHWRRAALPACAALGGMLAPAGLYLALAGTSPARSGWGVPMATDIAFAVGILTLLGDRVPAALRVLLLALAVIDDLGAIVVIALFYSSGIAPAGLLVAALGFGGILALQRLEIRSKLAYLVPSVVAWAGTYAAGIHPTIAGVIIGLLTPAPRGAASPAEGLIRSFHPWIAYAIMPAFALANAGVRIDGAALDASSWRVAGAVVIGLVAGKPLGILLACWLSLRLRLAVLPAGITFRHLLVLGVVAGIGFTMAIFIATLAFDDLRLLAAAKLGVLAASTAAGVLGLAFGALLLARTRPAEVASSADEAERSTGS